MTFYYTRTEDGRTRRFIVGLMEKRHLAAVIKGLALKQALLPDSYFFQNGNTEQTIRELVLEYRRRKHPSGYIRHLCQRLAPDPCECGNPGIYVVGHRTYCKVCRYKGEAKLRRRELTFFSEESTVVEETQRAIVRAEKHHKARGRR